LNQRLANAFKCREKWLLSGTKSIPDRLEEPIQRRVVRFMRLDASALPRGDVLFEADSEIAPLPMKCNPPACVAVRARPASSLLYLMLQGAKSYERAAKDVAIIGHFSLRDTRELTTLWTWHSGACGAKQ
jgi:hypothetical protein